MMRIKKLQKTLYKKKIDLAVFFSLDEKPDTNLQYFSGYSGIGILCVTKKKSYLFVPDMEYEKARKTKLTIVKAEKKRRLLETIKKKLVGQKLKKIGVDFSNCSISLFNSMKKNIKGKYVDISNDCYILRKIKEESEIDCIKRACKVTDNIFEKILKNFEFKTEDDIRDFIENEVRKAGCGLAFPPIVASGKNTSLPHYEGNSKIKDGFLMLDYGARYNGYCADMTRMIYIGKPKKEELERYDIVLKTVLDVEKSIKKNRKFSDLYKTSLSCLGILKDKFTHALGHGLGIEIHEPPSLYESDLSKIEEDIAFTVEPGIYFPGKYGIRIEDTVILKNNKLEILTKSGKELVIIG